MPPEQPHHPQTYNPNKSTYCDVIAAGLQQTTHSSAGSIASVLMIRNVSHSQELQLSKSPWVINVPVTGCRPNVGWFRDMFSL